LAASTEKSRPSTLPSRLQSPPAKVMPVLPKFPASTAKSAPSTLRSRLKSPSSTKKFTTESCAERFPEKSATAPAFSTAR
jgi:hypothetical protein